MEHMAFSGWCHKLVPGPRRWCKRFSARCQRKQNCSRDTRGQGYCNLKARWVSVNSCIAARCDTVKSTILSTSQPCYDKCYYLIAQVKSVFFAPAAASGSVSAPLLLHLSRPPIWLILRFLFFWLMWKFPNSSSPQTPQTEVQNIPYFFRNTNRFR